ncbi:hypothetical protein WICPIJ_007091 [Wickerhamomyces pijperi]|uniref:Uncharacterized protein n=1 Tax=Wickerhamomyces pijperi TaxID=599730 RepID=A0A9P8Q368_WICPI|nr:hypothetical protein WICPIJ_007091 [Wickerhamomyces pijperi]
MNLLLATSTRSAVESQSGSGVQLRDDFLVTVQSDFRSDTEGVEHDQVGVFNVLGTIANPGLDTVWTITGRLRNMDTGWVQSVFFVLNNVHSVTGPWSSLGWDGVLLGHHQWSLRGDNLVRGWLTGVWVDRRWVDDVPRSSGGGVGIAQWVWGWHDVGLDDRVVVTIDSWIDSQREQMLMVVGVDLWVDSVPVDTVFVVGSSEDLGDDQSGGSGDNGGTKVVSEIGVLSQPKANGLVIKPAPYSPISKACFLKCLKLGSPYGTTISARDILWKIGLTLPWSLDTFWLGDVDWLDIGSVTVLLDRVGWVEVGVFFLGQRSSDLWNVNEDDLLGLGVNDWDEIQWVGVLGVVFGLSVVHHSLL